MSAADERYLQYAALVALQAQKEADARPKPTVEEPASWEPLLVRECFHPLPTLH